MPGVSDEPTACSDDIGGPGGVALPALPWKQGDSGSVSASACFFLAAELENAKWEVPVGVIQVPVSEYRKFIGGAKDWKEAVRGQVNVDTLMGANRIWTDFVSTVQELHSNNLNDFKLMGILTNDAPLPSLESNSVFMRPPVQVLRPDGPRLHLWPFRCAVVPAK